MGSGREGEVQERAVVTECCISAGSSAVTEEEGTGAQVSPACGANAVPHPAAKGGPTHVHIDVGGFPGPPIWVSARLGLQPVRWDGGCTEQHRAPSRTVPPASFGLGVC